METQELIIHLIESDKQKLLLEKQKEIQILQDELDYGAIGNMEWFCERVNLSNVEAKRRILYPYRSELEGRLVKYPESQGMKWQFNKSLVNEWIVENFERW